MKRYFFVLKQYNRECNCILVTFSFLIIIVNISMADEVLLKNGEIIKGNIQEMSAKVLIDVVIDNKIIGAKITLSKNEVKEIKKDGKYLSLEKKEISKKDQTLNSIKLKERTALSSKINKQILKRVQREATRIKEIEVKQEDKRRFEKSLQHEKEMEVLEGEIQKDLIKESVKYGVNPKVYITNRN